MRKLMIALAAATAIVVGMTAETSSPAFARGGGGHGGGGGGHGGMGHGGMGHGGMGHGGMGHGGFGRAAGIGHGGVARAAFAHSGMGRVGAVRAAGFHGNRLAFRNRFAFRHHRFHRRFAFIGAGFAYSAYDSCLTPVWTPWGWRWTNVCY